MSTIEPVLVRGGAVIRPARRHARFGVARLAGAAAFVVSGISAAAPAHNGGFCGEITAEVIALYTELGLPVPGGDRDGAPLGACHALCASERQRKPGRGA